MCDLIAGRDVRFAYSFESIYAACITLADLHYFAKTTFSDNLQEFEWVDRKRFSLMIMHHTSARCTRYKQAESLTYSTWSIRYTDLNLPRATREVIADQCKVQVIEIGSELDSSKEEIVAKIVP